MSEALQLKITGEGKVTSLLNEYTWIQKAKLEQDFTLDNTDVDGRTFDLSDFTTIDFLVVSSDKEFELTVTKSVGSLEISTSRIFLLTPNEALTSVTVISTTSEGQSFSIRVYEGE